MPLCFADVVLQQAAIATAVLGLAHIGLTLL